MALIYRGVYLYNEKDSPRIAKNGKSEIALDIKITPRNDTTSLYGTIETVIATEEIFKKIGYTDNQGKHIACCDEDAAKRNKCNNPNVLLMPDGYQGQYFHQETKLDGTESSIRINYHPQDSGIYYVVTAICDYHVSPLVMDGSMIVENPYGHLPATQYGDYPFVTTMCIVYILTLLVWAMLCIRYSKEIMSVQVIILIVLIAFSINYIVKVIYYSIYNKSGNSVFFLNALFLLTDSFARALTRILTLLVCMGLGVCKASLSTSTFTFILYGVLYFIVAFWDSYSNMYPSQNETMDTIRLFITSAVDAVIYFAIFQSLMKTMDELIEKKQDAKLAIFTKLRNLLIMSVIIATVTLIVFSVIVLKDENHQMWKYQWFMNDGIWTLYYYVLFVAIMVMWKPSENSSAYAYHLQVATNEQVSE